MSETFRVTYLTGVAKLPEMVVRVRSRGVEAAEQLATYGYRVEIAPDLPPGTLAATGYYTADGEWFGLGSFLEPERALTIWERIASLFRPAPPPHPTA